jgi:hypothetical protein
MELRVVNNKSCSKCGADKPETVEFFRWRNDRNKFRNSCIKCEEAQKKLHRLNNPEKTKKISKKAYEKRKANGKHQDSELRRKYNITLDDYNKMFQEQSGCCKLCGIHQSEVSRTFAVDHCHKHEKETGEILVRGLLCDNCNLGLGNFQDNIKTMRLAVKYLNKNGDI